MKYVRYQTASGISYGVLEGDTIRELRGDLFENSETGVTRKLSGVKLLRPGTPGKIVCVGRNYASHLGERPKPSRPQMFYKPPSSLADPGQPIVIPREATNVHYEGELVLVIGTHLKRASKEQAQAGIFGAACGNDVTEREWQYGADKDIQYWRSKGADTFGPFGPCVATGLNYDNLLLQTRLNGEVVQKQSTSDLIFSCATVVSFISQWVTLERGDLIFTGTPQATRPMKPGDTVEVEIEGIGVLSNPVAAE
jgi:2-keto-4-pentenoate hydratase/2-oxohepta-3-ene-1,7-dioic acid hydratase in catechol pathway